MNKFEKLSDSVEDLWELVLRHDHSIENLQRTCFTAPEPEPACKLAQDWMLQHLKDIASEIEIESDLKLWDSVQDLEESI